MGWPERDIAQSAGFIAPPGYQRHRPETTLLYRLVGDVLPRQPVRQWVLSLPLLFEPEDFIARLVALVPKRRAHLTRYHGVFAPASPDRARVVPKPRVAAAPKAVESSEPSTTDRQRALTWAQRLKRVFAIDIEVCRRCGGQLRVIASIEDPPARRASLFRLY